MLLKAHGKMEFVREIIDQSVVERCMVTILEDQPDMPLPKALY